LRGKGSGRVWVKLAIGLWVLFAVLACVKVGLDPISKSVIPDYSSGSQDWWNDKLYKVGGGYLYTPTFSIAFTPFDVLPARVGYALWHLLTLGVFFWSLRVLVRDVLPLRWNPRREGLFLLLSLVGSIRALWSGQANALVFSLMIFGAVAAARQNWWAAAFLLAVPVFIKIWPLAFVLLLVSCGFRRLAWRFVVASSVYAAIPFLTRPFAIVLQQYESYFAMLVARQQDRDSRAHDAWAILEQFHPVNANLYAMLQLSTALAVLGWCLWRSRRAPTAFHRIASIMAMWIAWQILFGPGAERQTYIILAPLTTWAVLASFDQQRLRALAVAAWITSGVLGAGIVERTMLPIFPVAPAIQPCGAVMYLVWVILFYLDDRTWPPSSNGP